MTTWTNWVGNQSFTPAERAAPASEDEVATLVADAAERGLPVRVAGAGHSFTPVVATDGLLLDLRGLGGIRSIDASRRRVVVGPATTIGEFGEPLWAEGLALANQGDIIAQQIAGAVCTGTHGSGFALAAFSSGRCAAPAVVTATGDVVEIGEDDPSLLHAAQVSVGMLGVITEIELAGGAGLPAARADRALALGRAGSASTSWRRSTATTRSSGSRRWTLRRSTGSRRRRVARRHVLREDLRRGRRLDGPTRRRRAAASGRSYVIYPMVFEPNFHELEYFVPFAQGRAALAAMRELMLASLPASVFPMEVRTVGRDEAFLSHSYGRTRSSSPSLGRPERITTRTCATSTGCSARSTRGFTGGSFIT